QAVQEYPQALQNIINAGVDNVVPAGQLRILEQTIRAGGGDVAAQKAERYRAYLNQALVDEVLTPAEERVVDAVGNALVGDDEDEAQKAILQEYRAQLFIAMVNDGRLPERTDGPINLKRGETLHLVESA